MSDPNNTVFGVSDHGQTIFGFEHGDHGQDVFNFGGVKIDVPGPVWFQSTVGIIFSIVAIASFIWVVVDGDRRGKSGCLVFVFILAAGWPLSLVWWLWLRPPLPDPQFSKDDSQSPTPPKTP